MKVAVVGATGMVGEVMLKVLAERKFPISELLLVASERSVGKTIEYGGITHTVIGIYIQRANLGRQTWTGIDRIDLCHIVDITHCIGWRFAAQIDPAAGCDTAGFQ